MRRGIGRRDWPDEPAKVNEKRERDRSPWLFMGACAGVEKPWSRDGYLGVAEPEVPDSSRMIVEASENLKAREKLG